MVQLDPHHTGKTIRKAFLLESILNLFTLPLIFFPRPILSFLLLNPEQDLNNAVTFFAQCFGGLVVGALTPALWYGLPQTKSSIESRRPTYILLAGGEAFLIPLLISQALKGGDIERGAAISPLVAVLAMGGLVPPLVWRGYVLLRRPELLGKYRDLGGKQE
jgi:Na+-driven multidrug efflux pump